MVARIASRCISNTLGVEVITNDTDGQQGAYDLRLTYRERTIELRSSSWWTPAIGLQQNKSSEPGSLSSTVSASTRWSACPPQTTIRLATTSYRRRGGGVVPEMDQAVASACKLMSSTNMAKLRKQPAAAEASERHAFLIYGWEHMEAVPFSQVGPLPRIRPTLPNGIDGVWLSSTASSSPAVAWIPDHGWIRAAPMT